MAALHTFLLVAMLPAALCLYGPLEHKLGLSDSAKFYIMCQHNKLRSLLAKGELDSKWKQQPKAADMQCLCWCEELVPKAQTHASDCGGPSHDKRSGRSSANFPDVGQSLMDCLPSSPIDEALEAFLEEINGYDYDSNSCDASKAGRAGVCGHYTALMWAKTQCLGCAYDSCEGKGAHGRLVCNYGPGGNVQGNKPYAKGEPCSQCGAGQSCLDGGLCCDCSGGRCGSKATAAGSSGGSCKDADDYAAKCPQFKAMGVCSPSSNYYMFASTYCRATCGLCGGVDRRKICTAGFNISSDHCSVHSSVGAQECKTGNGLYYAGTKTTTASGYTCKQWATATSYYHDFEFPERSKAKAQNYCRNPGASGSAPWCYVEENTAGASWEYCSIPDC